MHYTPRMVWDVEYTDEFGAWWETLTEREQDAITATVAFLEEQGPALGRPLVDSTRHSRHPNKKELRPPGGNMRILFAFDPRRTAILLIGGDKAGRWQQWYDEIIPVADDLYDEHLQSLRREGRP